MAEPRSCTKPGSVISAERVPPPTVSSASSTATDRPLRASSTAAARPFGPAPTTTASYTPGSVTFFFPGLVRACVLRPPSGVLPPNQAAHPAPRTRHSPRAPCSRRAARGSARTPSCSLSVLSSGLLAHHCSCRPSPQRYEKRYETPLPQFSRISPHLSPLRPYPADAATASHAPAAWSLPPPRPARRPNGPGPSCPEVWPRKLRQCFSRRTSCGRSVVYEALDATAQRSEQRCYRHRRSHDHQLRVALGSTERVLQGGHAAAEVHPCQGARERAVHQRAVAQDVYVVTPPGATLTPGRRESEVRIERDRCRRSYGGGARSVHRGEYAPAGGSPGGAAEGARRGGVSSGARGDRGAARERAGGPREVRRVLPGHGLRGLLHRARERGARGGRRDRRGHRRGRSPRLRGGVPAQVHRPGTARPREHQRQHPGHRLLRRGAR